MTQPIGFIGLGLMGFPMASNLLHADYEVHAWNLVAEPVRRLAAAGAVAHRNPREVAASASSVIVMVPDLPDVRALLEGPDGLLAAGNLTTLVVMGTVSPVGVKALAQELALDGVTVIDAPVSGGVTGATDGTLAIMVGGEDRAVADVRPALHVLGSTVVHLGPSGAGALAKACNQIVVAGTLVSLAEAALLARAHGLDVGEVLDVLGGGLAASEVLRQKRQAMVDEDYSPSGPAKFLIKDLAFALEAGAGPQLDMPVTRIVQDLFVRLTDEGLGDLDNTVILEYLRRHSGTASRGTAEREAQGGPR